MRSLLESKNWNTPKGSADACVQQLRNQVERAKRLNPNKVVIPLFVSPFGIMEIMHARSNGADSLEITTLGRDDVQRISTVPASQFSWRLDICPKTTRKDRTIRGFAESSK
jgi:hypothetical protein